MAECLLPTTSSPTSSVAIKLPSSSLPTTASHDTTSNIGSEYPPFTRSRSHLTIAISIPAVVVLVIISGILLLTLLLAKKLKEHKNAPGETDCALNELNGQSGTYEVIDRPNISQESYEYSLTKCTDSKEIATTQNEAYAVHKERNVEVKTSEFGTNILLG